MKRFCLLVSLGIFCEVFPINPSESGSQPPRMRNLCKQVQTLEKEIRRLKLLLELIIQKEKTHAPVVRSIYEVISRCFTVLFNIQRFSSLLVLSQVEDKNDFIKCSIVIKNFAAYFRSVGTQLKKNVSEIVELNRDKKFTQRKLNEASDAHEEALAAIENLVKKLNDARLENPIQDNVVEHLARKSESLGELDAELEAENVIGVLRNTKVVTELELVYPVSGKIVTEFGDKDANNEMAHYIAFETYPDAVVTSPAKGLVVFAGRFLNYGNMLIISNGDYRVFLYGMDILFAFIGDLIEIGDYVGHMQSDPGTSPLVKMELRKFGEPLDPRHWMLETIEKREKTK